MKRQFRNIVTRGILGIALLYGIDANGVNIIPVYRGDAAAVELTDADINPTAIPEGEVIIGGTLSEGIRCFDLFCAGNCELISEELNLLMIPSEEIPNPVAPNSKGELVFAVPKPMCTAQMPVGCNSWVNINLTSISGGVGNNIRKYLALGIRNQEAQEYIDILYMPYANDSDGDKEKNHASTCIPMTDTDVLEFVPLISSTDIGGMKGYTKATIGNKVELEGVVASEFDFRSVYRINTQFQENKWRKVDCGLSNFGDDWLNGGHIGVGQIQGDNETFTEQLLAIGSSGKLTISRDGITWKEVSRDLEAITDTVNAIDPEIWDVGVAYGNKIWCAVSSEGKVARSLDGGKTWSHISTIRDMCPIGLAFGNGVFMVIDSTDNNSKVYTSLNGEEWKQVGAVDGGSFLCYGNGYWLCGDGAGNTFKSEDNGATWISLSSSDLSKISSGGSWNGGCYAYGYFYAIDDENNTIARSMDGEYWEKVKDVDDAGVHYYNVTVLNNRLYTFSSNGDSCFIGLFNSDRTLQLEKPPVSGD